MPVQQMLILPHRVEKRQGFTLIELLVTATIIAVLTTIGVVSFQATNLRARDGKRRADLEQTRAALELYRSDTTAGNGKYPSAGAFSDMTGILRTAKYLSDPLPVDPKNTNAYIYGYSVSNNQTSYCLCALFEGQSGTNSADATCNTIGQAGPYYCITNP